ncbi:LysR substrate-binding domain-containing protein [Shimia ponticola]|uniref:LysR substrate-binding domain-containing protein n=1 Tax=Shimia ponticola TaxID=2582893 RepID=UPI00164A5289|nr:LysR substrate-binding domain-containing protein [Shimia ponticola]
MSIRALRTLIAISRHGSFRAAADSESLTPSAISHQMKTLEQDLQLVLFDRTAKSPVLTQTGQRLVQEAEPIVTAYDNLVERVASGDAVSGDLVLGAVPTTLSGLVPRALASLKTDAPGIRVRIVPGLSNQLMLQLERNQIHAAIISRPDILPPQLHFAEITSEDLVLLAARKAEDLSAQDMLRSQPFIRFTRDAVVGRQIEAWLQRQDITVSDAMELGGLDAIANMVALNLGVSIVPESCLAEHRHLALRTVALDGQPPKRVLGLATPKTSPREEMFKAVQMALKRAV